MEMFALDPQGFSARCQDMNFWRLPKDALSQCGDGIDQMLATIEDEQEPPVTKKCEDGRNRIVGVNRNAKYGC